jgi:small subunit ribosomal protein S1
MSTKLSQKKNPDYFDAFNAEADADNDTEATKATERADFARMLGESLKGSNKKLKVGDKITGKILSLGKEETYVSTGTQHDGMIQSRELREADGTCTYKTDDLITLYVTQVRGTEIRLSKNPTDRNLAKDLEDAHDMMLPIQGRVVELCKGGVRVNIKGKLAFCPISQLDSKHIETADEYVGKSFDFRITQFSEGGKNIVVSRRKLLDEERDLGTASFLEENKDGDLVKGKVTKFEKFGAFVELAPGVDGLVHISEIAWSRIGDPSEVLQIGQEVTAKLLKREVMNGRAKISLSIKQAVAKEDRPQPASAPERQDPSVKYTVGQLLTAKVTRKEVYGFFLEIEPGLNGLLHKSRTFDNPEFRFEKVKIGDEITVQVAEIKKEERQIALSLPRDAGEDDWKSHQQNPAASLGSLGSLGDQWKAALAKRK